jgi:hypothetical protein
MTKTFFQPMGMTGLPGVQVSSFQRFKNQFSKNIKSIFRVDRVNKDRKEISVILESKVLWECEVKYS